MENGKLISVLEGEMRKDIQSIDVPSEAEDGVNIGTVRDWYFEAEKVIRVLANILSAPMNQAINQLRYAGHHILKAETDPNIAGPNLVEAFKHCKRAVYDALDFYVYSLNEKYRLLMPYLDSQNAIKLERLLHEHIKRIHLARTSNANRIDYYRGVQEGLIDGLKLIEEINEIQRETGVARELRLNKRLLVDENHRLQGYLDTLQNKNKELEDKISSRFSAFSLAFSLAVTVGLSLGVPIGLIITDAYITTKHEVAFTSEDNRTVDHLDTVRE